MQTRLVATDRNGHLPTSLLAGTRLDCQRAANVLPESRNPMSSVQHRTARWLQDQS